MTYQGMIDAITQALAPFPGVEFVINDPLNRSSWAGGLVYPEDMDEKTRAQARAAVNAILGEFDQDEQ